MIAVIKDIHRAHHHQSVLAKIFPNLNEPGATLRDSLIENLRRRIERQQASITSGTNRNNTHTGTNTRTNHISTLVRHTLGKSEICREMGKGRPHRAWSGGPGYSQNNGLISPLPKRAMGRG